MFTFLFVISVLFVILSVGCFVADHILTRSKTLNNFINSLPMLW